MITLEDGGGSVVDVEDSRVRHPSSISRSRRDRTPPTRYHPETPSESSSMRKRSSSNPTENESESENESSCFKPRPKVRYRQLSCSSIRFANSNVGRSISRSKSRAKQQNQTVEGDNTQIERSAGLKCPSSGTSGGEGKSEDNNVCGSQIRKPKWGKQDEYYEIDQILDRRVKLGSRGSSVVEYSKYH